MKKNNKKGFTIVELVIVIAVIAILAAVLIPTFSSVIKKAKVNNDIQLVRNLNTALATENKKHATMQDALDAAAKFGYDVAKINASATDNEILWDSVNDVFCYLNTEKNALEYIPSSVADDDKLSVNSYLLWKISDTVDHTYSTYYTGDATIFTGENAITKGFDAGTTKGITAIEYKNTGTEQKVVIRTNSFNTTLTISDSSTQGKIYHYDNLGKLIITNCAMESYHEMGIVGYAELQKGHLAVEENASINLLFANPQDSATLKITNNGTVTNAQASSETVKNTISGVDFNRGIGATVSNEDIQQSVQETHQSNCEHANVVVSKDEVKATCTQKGSTVEKKCQDCNKILVEQQEIPMLQHTLTHYDAVPATCNQNGNVEYNHCSVCNKNYADNGDLLENVVKEATGKHNYDSTHKCTVCKADEPGWEGFGGKVDANGKLQTEAFINVTSITTIVIPEGVTEIGTQAFKDCTSLESVTIPSTVTSILDRAFQGCSKLKSVTIPSGVKIISSHAFYECKALSNVTLPDGLTSIGQSAFAYCTALSSISIPNTVKTLGQSAFSESAITSITIPASVTTIDTYVFKNCTSLEKVILNATITKLPDGIFSGCSALKEITIPANVKTIGEAAFQGCRSLKAITIPDKVTSIGAQAFQDCTSLTTITIPANVKTIEKNAFKGAGLTTAEFKTTSGWKCTYHDYVNMRDVTKYNIPFESGASEKNANLLKGSTYNDPSFSRQ